MRHWTVLAIAILASGCIQAPIVQEASLGAKDMVAEASLLPGELPVVAQATFTEGQDAGDPSARTFNLTYHGVQAVFDEFGRPVPAYVFRYPIVVTEGDGTLLSPSRKAEHLMEFDFERATGRFVSQADLADGARAFRESGLLSPVATPFLSFMAVLAAGPNATKSLAGDVPFLDGTAYNATVLPWTSARLLPGGCLMWALEEHSTALKKPWTTSGTGPYDLESGPIVSCFDDGPIPLWIKDNQTGMTWQRESPGFDLPPLAGTLLPPPVYTKAPWTAVPSPIPAVPSTLGPPSQHKGDWADQEAIVVAAISTDPRFIAYRNQSGATYLALGFLHLPVKNDLEVLGIPIIHPPAGFQQEDALAFIGDDRSATATVLVRNGTQEQADQQVVYGFSDQPTSGEVWPATRLPLLVPAGAAAAQLKQILPLGDGQVWFGSQPVSTQLGPRPWVFWAIWTPCTDTRDGSFSMIDAQRGSSWGTSTLKAGSQVCEIFQPSEISKGFPSVFVHPLHQ